MKMSRSKKKGPFIHPSLLKKIKELNEKGEKKTNQNMEQSLYDSPGDDRTHYRRL